MSDTCTLPPFPRDPARARRVPRAGVGQAAALLASAVASGVAARPAAAQLAVLRTSEVAALEVDPGRRFPRPVFAGDFARGYGSTEDAHAWNLTLSGTVQLRTRGGRTALVGRVGHELTANPYNSGGLNPRGTAWEETVYLLQRVGGVELRGGVFFRCRHEVDATTPLDERPGALPSRMGTRIVMNKGVSLGLDLRPIALGPRTRLRAGMGVDHFTAREDWRIPRSVAGPHWARASGRGTLMVRLAHAASANVEPYARGWAATTMFEPDSAPGAVRQGTGARFEIGTRFGSRDGGAVDVFVVRERFFDDLTNPVPQRSRVLSVGVRLGSHALQ
jgi:hypothetical protein